MKSIMEMEAAVELAEAKHAAANAAKTAIWEAAVAKVQAAGAVTEYDGDRYWSAVEKAAGAAYVAAVFAVGAALRPVLEFLPQVREARKDRERVRVRAIHGPASDYEGDCGSGYGMNTED